MPPVIHRLLTRTELYLLDRSSAWYGLEQSWLASDGRNGNVTSHYSYADRGHEISQVFLYEEDLFGRFYSEPSVFSTTLHEIGHAVDHRLGWPSERLRMGEPLDSYAATSPQEQFAQAFGAMVIQPQVPVDVYCSHTMSEVAHKAPELHEFLRRLMHDRDAGATHGVAEMRR